MASETFRSRDDTNQVLDLNIVSCENNLVKEKGKVQDGMKLVTTKTKK